MHLALTRHPETPCAAVDGIAVDVARPDPDRLLLQFTVTGDIAALRVPERVQPARADELWKRTCLEAFLRPWGDGRYLELNLAPSTQWAAYAFDGYRAGMRNAEDAGEPAITVTRSDRMLHLRAAIDLRRAVREPWPLALSAVIEETSGAKSCWALAHPPGQPDFHHAASFAATLPSEVRA